MNVFDYTEVGKRIRILRKKKGYNQTELAKLLGKSLRTVQKYETGEIEVSISVVNQLAELLDTTPTYILGYEVKTAPISNLADIMNLFFQMETVTGLDLTIDVEKPPKGKLWQCGIRFDGKSASAEYNADICLFLEQWAQQLDGLHTYQTSQEDYDKWKDQTLAYYAATSVEHREPEIISREERLEKRKAYLESIYG